MGLDMYLNRMPRCKGVNAEQVCAIESWLDYENRSEKYADSTFESWCNMSEEDLPDKEVIDHYRQFYTKKYSLFDTERKYGWDRIMEQVGYWRKANAIHNWFVDNVQYGEDDCHYHREVTKEMLELLKATCEVVIQESKLVPGKLHNGSTYKNGREYKEYIDGLVVEDSTTAERLLPTTSGFFFGGTDYDEWYIKDLKETIEIIDRVLETTNFETHAIYYVSSW